MPSYRIRRYPITALSHRYILRTCAHIGPSFLDTEQTSLRPLTKNNMDGTPRNKTPSCDDDFSIATQKIPTYSFTAVNPEHSRGPRPHSLFICMAGPDAHIPGTHGITMKHTHRCVHIDTIINDRTSSELFASVRDSSRPLSAKALLGLGRGVPGSPLVVDRNLKHAVNLLLLIICMCESYSFLKASSHASPRPVSTHCTYNIPREAGDGVGLGPGAVCGRHHGGDGRRDSAS